jgi:hypothetical protein
MDDKSWATLVDSIRAGTCTPFLGAGVASPHLPIGSDLSSRLAKQYEYPLADPGNLSRVSQYIATMWEDPVYAKRQVLKEIEAQQLKYLDDNDGAAPPNFRMLAKLDCKIFVTTNYDRFLEIGLKAARKDPVTESCRWTSSLWRDLGPYPRHTASVREPIIFHLHGQASQPQSILVTESDYVEFTVSLALKTDQDDPIWPPVLPSLANNLLFIGYSLQDWNFRVLMQYLLRLSRVVRSAQPASWSIQLADTKMDPDQRRRAEEYLNKYQHVNSAIQVEWSDANEFLEMLIEKLASE